MTQTKTYFKPSVECVRESTYRILRHSQDDYPNEAVGMVWEDGSSTPLVNEVGSGREFHVSEKQLIRAFLEFSQDRNAVAFYHSHPNGSLLSPTDRRCMSQWADQGIVLPWVIATPDFSIYYYKWDEFNQTANLTYHWTYDD